MLDRLVLVQAHDAQAVLWAAEQALRCPAIGAVLAWPVALDDRRVRRLQLAAETGGSCGLLYRPPTAALPSSPAALRLRLKALSPGLHVVSQEARCGRALLVCLLLARLRLASAGVAGFCRCMFTGRHRTRWLRSRLWRCGPVQWSAQVSPHLMANGSAALWLEIGAVTAARRARPVARTRYRRLTPLGIPTSGHCATPQGRRGSAGARRPHRRRQTRGQPSYYAGVALAGAADRPMSTSRPRAPDCNKSVVLAYSLPDRAAFGPDASLYLQRLVRGSAQTAALANATTLLTGAANFLMPSVTPRCCHCSACWPHITFARAIAP